MDSGIAGWIKQKIQSIIESRPQFITDQTQFRLIKEIKGYYGVYDGKEHSPEIRTAEGCRIEFSQDQRMWVLSVPLCKDAGIYKYWVRVTRNRWVEQCELTIEIRKRQITLSSASKEKVYDGKPFSDENVVITGEGIVDNDTFSARATGVQILVGTCPNLITYSFSSKGADDNYLVEKNEGVLSVLPREDKFHVVIEANSARFVYDGKEHSVSGFRSDYYNVEGVNFKVSGLDAHAVLCHAGTVQTTISGQCLVTDMDGNDVTDQFSVSITPGTLCVKPREVLLRSASSTQEYNGHYLINTAVDVLKDGFCEGDQPIIAVSGKQRLVGESENSFSFSFPESVCPDDYSVDKEYGLLVVNDRAEKYHIDIHLKGAECIYDGETHYVSGVEEETIEIDGNTFHVAITDVPVSGKDAGKYEHVLEHSPIIYDDIYQDISDQFEVNIIPSALVIHKRKIILESESLKKQYDGTSLINNNVKISGDGLADGDNIEVHTTGVQTTVGISANTIDYLFIGSKAACNYSIEKKEGFLEVTDRIDKPIINVVARSLTALYDGTEHYIGGFENKTFDINGHTFSISGINANASLIHAGSVETVITGKAIVYDEGGNDVSSQFNVSVSPGTLCVTPRNVIIKSGSSIREYNGSYLFNPQIDIEGDGFLDGDKPYIAVSGMQQTVGKSDNLFSYQFPASVRTEDYNITPIYGTLEVIDRGKKHPLVVTLTSQEILYDAEEHTVAGIEEEELVIDGNTYRLNIVDKPATGRTVGVYPHAEILSAVIYDSDGNDVTAQFNLIIRHGTLIIKCRNITLISASGEKEYDGIPLSVGKLEIQGDGLVAGDEIEPIYTGSQLLVGQSKNTFSYYFRQKDARKNYNVRLVEGMLTVKPRKVPLEVSFVGESRSFLYDGEEKSLPQYEHLMFYRNGVLFSALGITNVVSGTEEGIYIPGLPTNLKIVDQYANDVTDQFRVIFTPGKLTILHNPAFDTLPDDNNVVENPASADEPVTSNELDDNAKSTYVTSLTEENGRETVQTLKDVLIAEEEHKELDFIDNDANPVNIESADADILNGEDELSEDDKLIEGSDSNQIPHSAEVIDEYDIAIHDILNRVSGKTTSDDVKKYSRKELENLYQDTKELLYVKGDIDPDYQHALKHWDEKSEIAILRNRLVDQVPDITLLSEIEVSDKEFELLSEYARKRINNAQINSDYVAADFLFTLTMVQIGIRYYEYNFWPQVGKVLHGTISQTERKWIGNTVTKTLHVLGKPVYSETEYVTNILMHCFVADSYASRFFDYLFSFYRIDLERDVSGIQQTDIDYICDSIINPYAKRKQLLSDYTAMSVRADREYCKRVIEQSLYMIDCRFWDEDLYEEDSLTGRLRQRFDEWSDHSDFYQSEKQKNKQKMSGEQRIRMFRTPHLICDNDNGTFTILLPPQMIPVNDEKSLPEVKWFIVSSERREYRCDLEEGYSGFRTKPRAFTVTSEEIFSRFVFLLFSDQTLLRSFNWDAHEAVFFSENWEGIKADNLSPGKVYAFCKHTDGIISESVLYEGWEHGLRYYELGLKDGDFVQVQGEDNYYVGKIPSPGLSYTNYVSGVYIENISGERIPVYNLNPQIVIEVEDGQLQGTAVFANGKINRLADMHFIDIHVGNTSDTKYYFVHAGELEGVQEGHNSITVDYPNSTKHLHVEYYLLQGFKYKFSGAPYIFTDSGSLILYWATFEEEPRTVNFNMSDLVEGILAVDYEGMNMKYIVPLLLTSWDRETWTYLKYDDIWHNDFQSILYIKYPADSISLFVGGSAKYESACNYHVRADGIFNCDLTRLKSYFDDNKMISTICIDADDKETELLRVIQKSFLISAKLTADPGNRQIKAEFDIVGKNEYFADLYCEDVLLAEKEPIENNEILFRDIDVDTADYTVIVYESDDEFGFDEDFELVGKKTQSLINASDLVGGRMKVKYISYGSKHQTLDFPPEYDYYLFLEEQRTNDTYDGIVAGVFRKKEVMYASKVSIRINDLSDPREVCVSGLYASGKPGNLLIFDRKKTAIVDFKEKYLWNKRYIQLSQDTCTWSVEYIGANARLLTLANKWIVEQERLKNKPFTIWKN